MGMDVLTLIRPLEQIETGMQALYEALAARFGTEDPEASQVFCRLAFEERSHIAKLQYLRRLSRQLAQPLAPVEVERRALDEEVEALEELLVRVPTLSLAEALTESTRVEHSAGELHGRIAIVETNPELKAVLTGLRDEDERHAQRLAALAQSRGVA